MPEQLRPNETLRRSATLAHQEEGRKKRIKVRTGDTFLPYGRYSSLDNSMTIVEIMPEPIVYEGTKKEVAGFWVSLNRQVPEEEGSLYPMKEVPDGMGGTRRLYQVTEDTVVPALVRARNALKKAA